MRVVVFTLILLSAPALAEPTVITQVKPTDDKICKIDQMIVVVRCEKGTAILCEDQGLEMHYSCIDGAPSRTLPSPAGTELAAHVRHLRPHEQAVHHHYRRFVHRTPIKQLFNFLFHH